jgi:hypothetical protein
MYVEFPETCARKIKVSLTHDEAAGRLFVKILIITLVNFLIEKFDECIGGPRYECRPGSIFLQFPFI